MKAFSVAPSPVHSPVWCTNFVNRKGAVIDAENFLR